MRGLVFAAIAIMGWIAMHVDHGQDWLKLDPPDPRARGRKSSSARVVPEQGQGLGGARPCVTIRTPAGGHKAR
jgi:hypothetical protein